MRPFIAILGRNLLRLLLTFVVIAVVTWFLVGRADNSLYDPYCDVKEWLYPHPCAPQ